MWLHVKAGLRKNWLLATRHKKEWRAELVQTCLLLGILFLFSSVFSNVHRDDEVAFRPNNVRSLHSAGLGAKVIGLAVQNGTCPPQLLSALRAAANTLSASSVLCFPSPTAMEERAVGENDVLAGFVLPSDDPLEDAIQGRLNVVLRTNHTLLGTAPYGSAFTSAPYVSQLSWSLYGPAPSAFEGTFTALQAILGEALLQMAADAHEAAGGERPWPNTTRALNLAVQQFPVPAHSLNLGSNTLRALLPIYLTMLFSYQLRSFLQRVLEEKEGKLKELLRMAGLSPAAYWLSWILAAGAKGLFLVVAATAVLAAIAPQADVLLIFLFLAIFSASSVAFACVVAAIFSKAKTGTGAGMMVFLVSYLPTVLAVVLGNPSAGLYSVDGVGGSSPPTGIETTASGHLTGSAVGFLLVGLLSPSAFAMGLVVINDAEMVGSGGARWSALNTRFSAAIPLPLGTLLLLLSLDTALYTFLAWYLDQVLPQEFGVRKHPLFCLRRRQRGSAPGTASDPLMAALPPAGHRPAGEPGDAARGAAASERAAAAGATDALQSLRSRQPESWDGTFADVQGPVEPLSGEGWTAPLRIQGLTKVFPGAKSDNKGGANRPAGRGRIMAALARLCPRRAALGERQRLESEMISMPGSRRDAAASEEGAEGGRERSPSWRFRRSYQPLSTSDRSPRGDGGAEEEGAPALQVGCEDLVAVDNLWLSVYEGQITALLGHNGAGKSTTISLLSGLFETSVGDASVYGRSLVEDSDGVRQLLGVCPQQDTLYDKLTPAEHLRLFAELRGVDEGRAQRRAAFYLEHLGLAPKRDALTETLSGGQKRKLCIAAALIGEPRVLLLDEPTSGMDAASRRQVWSLLEACKKDRVTLLLTHDMSEAEYLADRVCILSKGRLSVVGSGLFLKSAFDLGYTLTLRTRVPPGVDARAATSDLVHRHVPDAAVVIPSAGVSAPLPQWAVDADDSTGSAPNVHLAGPSASQGREGASAEHIVAFTLPMHQSPAFPALLRALERAVEATTSSEPAPEGETGLVVRAYGLSVTSLEEVFLKLAEEEERAEEEKKRGEEDVTRTTGAAGATAKESHEAEGNEWTPVVSPSPESSSARTEGGAAGGLALAPVQRRPSIKAQAASVLRRRLLTSRRDYRSTWLQVGAPLLMMTIAITFRSFTALGGKEAEPEQLATAPLDWAAAAPPDVAPRPMLAPYTSHPMHAHLADTGAAVSAAAEGRRRLAGADSAQAWVEAVFNASRPSSPWPPASLGAPTPVDLTHGAPSPPHTSEELGAALLAMFRAHNATSVAAYEPGAGKPYAATVLYNTTLTRSLPAAVASLHGALLRSVAGCGAELGDACGPGPGLTASVHPFPKLPSEGLGGIGAIVAALATGYYVGIGFTLLPSVQAMAVVKERATRARAMQRVAGVRSLAYWLGMLAHDAVLLVPVAVVGTLVLTAGFGSSLYGDFPTTGITAYLLTFAVGGVAAAPMAYVLALFFTSQVTAQTYISIIISLLHTITFTIGVGLHFVASSFPAAATMINILQLFPPFSVSYSILMVAAHTSCSGASSEQCSPPPLLAWEFMGSTVVMTLLPVPFALLGVVWADGRPGGMSCGNQPAPAPQGRIAQPPPSAAGNAASNAAAIPVLAGQSVAAEEEDLDVQGERAIVHMGGASAEGTVVLRHLGKVFGRRKPVLAVRDVSLRMFRGECFGLLGPNGAGKTTTVRTLTGEHLPSVGDARILGHTLLSGPDRDLAFQRTGSCPQENALFPFLTVRENLEFFARLRGVDPAEEGAEVTKIVAALGLGAHGGKLFSKCSGGTQRRACLAASLMGRPDVLFLDEASTGLDPVARRQMWSLIRAVRDSGSLVVLTSHSLEEAEALCDRLAIMINGAVTCLGPPGHLKRKYGTGYQLELSVDLDALAAQESGGADGAGQPVAGVLAAGDNGDGAPAETPAQGRVREFVQEAFGAGAALLEQHGGHSRWSLPDAGNAAPSGLFQALEDERHRLAIRDYALSQTTLEQVFVGFARRQRT